MHKSILDIRQLKQFWIDFGEMLTDLTLVEKKRNLMYMKAE